MRTSYLCFQALQCLTPAAPSITLNRRHRSVGDDVRLRNEINCHAADESMRQEETQEEKTPPVLHHCHIPLR
jgi:hypothetical protein